MMPEVRASRAERATACSLVVAGVLLHRLNVAVFGLRVRHWDTYVPSFGEIGITLGIAAGAVFVFGVLARILPIHEEMPRTRSAPAPHAAAPAAAWRNARGVSSCDARPTIANLGLSRRPGTRGARQPHPDHRPAHAGARDPAACCDPTDRPRDHARRRRAAP